MALSEDNQRWIREEIKKAIDEISPLTKTRRLLRFLKDWGLTTFAVGLPITLIGILVTVVLRDTSDVKEEATFRAHTQDRLDGIEKSLLILRAEKAANSPTERKSQIEALDVLGSAKKAKTSLPVGVVQDVGNSFVGVSKDSPDAWRVALEFAAYRTLLNTNSIPHSRYETVPITHYVIESLDGRQPKIKSTANQRLPISSSARYEPIDHPIPQDADTGPAWLSIIGGALSLDGMFIRRAVFSNAEIHYSGGQLMLDSVLFVNCTFVFDNAVNDRQLANQILASSTVSFRSVG